jgi:Mrp family chromosome partitioning ATPase
VFEEFDEAQVVAREPAHQAALEPGSYVAEGYRLLRAKVQALGEETAFRCIGLASAAPGEGKTTVALGLALAMAQERDRRVILVEADLRKRSLAGYLGLEPQPGLSEWLQDKVEGPVPVRRLGSEGPYLLVGGVSEPRSPEILSSGRMARLLEACRAFFDYVVVDCPPLTPVADAVLLQHLLDGLLVVVRARSTPKETLVFNDYRELITSVYKYSQRKYGGDF